MILNKNNNIKKKIIIPFSILSITTLLSLIGKSSYVLPGNEIDLTIKEDKDVKPVCYIDSNKDIKYTSIEKALEVAKNNQNSDTIYVIPGTNPIITRNCEIAKGDTLCLPYEDNGNDVHTFLNRNDTTINATFGDSNSDNVNKNRKNQVTLRESVSLTNNGTLTVGGSIGYGGSAIGLTGQTAGSYCEILMNENAGIFNNNILNIYGYIKESFKENGSFIQNSNSSKTYLPFVIYDFRGGSYSYACKKENVMPFNIFDFPNCQVSQNYSYNSKMYGLATIYAGEQWNNADILIIGNKNDSCLFKLSDGNIKFKYNPSNFLYTTNDAISDTTMSTANYTEIYTYSDIQFSSISLKISIASIDTKEMHCPICFKYKIFIENKTFQISNKAKFLGGSLLYVKEGATLICDSEVSFYQNYVQEITTGLSNTYPSSLESGRLINDGTVNLNNSFGGLIETTAKSGMLNTAESFRNYTTTLEILSSKNSSFLASADKKESKTFYAEAYIGTASKPENPSRLDSNLSLPSKGDYWQKPPLSDITNITIVSENGTSTEGGKEGKFNLSALVDPSENASSSVTYNWSCDSGASLSSYSGKSVTLTTPANESEKDISYRVTCKVSFTKSDGTNGELTAEATFIATKTDSGCITSNTLILMSNGTYKKAIDIRANDLVMSINHETGKIEPTPIVFNDHIDKEADIYDVLSLEFSNDKTVEIVYEHGFFDLDTNKYEYITLDNYQSFIGHRFVSVDYINAKFIKGIATLNKGYITNKFTRICSPVTYKNLNIITENMLSMPGGISGLFNIFEYDKNLAYDQVKENEDINKYGLLDYSYFNNLIPYEVYEAFNGKYLKVAMGKGILTKKQLNNYIERYLPIISKQNNCH